MNFEPQELLANQQQLRNEQTEAAALSILMNFPAAFDDVSDRLKPEHCAVMAPLAQAKQGGCKKARTWRTATQSELTRQAHTTTPSVGQRNRLGSTRTAFLG